VAFSAAIVCATMLPLGASPATAAPPKHDSSGTQFYVPKPGPEAKQQIAHLRRSGTREDAELLQQMVETPTAVWFTSGTPKQVQHDVRKTVDAAARQGTVPVLVAYNLPYRDCSQYSAGGAANMAEYKAWIDAFAAGIGDREAIVILEPDGLGIIPWYTTINGDKEWCQPADANPETAAAERFEMLNYAVDALKAQPKTKVYLDGTHSGWLGVGDAADRLVKAGVQRADGFFLNVSNYQTTERQLKYGDWISKCIYYGTNDAEGGWRLGHFEYCASQYYPADPNDFSTWTKTDQWYADNVDNAANSPSGPEDLAHFVIDTSRNGQGPWVPPAGVYPDPQDWCNPPDRGLGIRPTTATGDPLADAFLWIKVPGESDGQCDRGTGTGHDPARGNIVDPAAGDWFPQQALELVHLAQPPLQ
jgi:endoglucanase